jgi:hypothetical protein
MACPTCGHPDDIDRSAEGRGLLLKSEAARQARRSATWVSSRIAEGKLATATLAGRPYVIAASLRRLLTVEGVPSDVDLKIDRLLAQHDWDGAGALHRATYPQAYAGSATPSGPESHEVTSPGEAFVRKMLGGDR